MVFLTNKKPMLTYRIPIKTITMLFSGCNRPIISFEPAADVFFQGLSSDAPALPIIDYHT